MNPPVITQPEIAVVILTAIFLCLAPAMFAWSDARQRRRELLAATKAAAAAAAVRAPGLAPDWSSEASFPTDAAFTGVAESTAAEAPVAPAEFAESPPPPSAPAEAPATEAATFRLAPSEPLVAPPIPIEPPAAAVPAEPAASPLLSDALPVRQVASFAPAPAAMEWRERCQLIELRQARLADWPPPAVRGDSELLRIWQEGERLAGNFDRAISTTPLSVPVAVQAAALGAVETDARVYRLHFLLFDDLWPNAPDQARAAAVFEVDPGSGVLRSWVERH